MNNFAHELTPELLYFYILGTVHGGQPKGQELAIRAIKDFLEKQVHDLENEKAQLLQISENLLKELRLTNVDDNGQQKKGYIGTVVKSTEDSLAFIKATKCPVT